jgi:hypothetical protein
MSYRVLPHYGAYLRTISVREGRPTSTFRAIPSLILEHAARRVVFGAGGEKPRPSEAHPARPRREAVALSI